MIPSSMLLFSELRRILWCDQISTQLIINGIRRYYWIDFLLRLINLHFINNRFYQCLKDFLNVLHALLCYLWFELLWKIERIFVNCWINFVNIIILSWNNSCFVFSGINYIFINLNLMIMIIWKLFLIIWN